MSTNITALGSDVFICFNLEKLYSVARQIQSSISLIFFVRLAVYAHLLMILRS